MSTFPDRSRSAGWIGFALAAAAVLAPVSALAEPYVYRACAHIVDVERSFVHQTTTTVPGAGVRAFQDPETENGGIERFEVHWYANPPGIPPAAVILLETIQERRMSVKNHVLQTNDKSQGHVRSIIEIPANEIRREGRVVKWRVRVVWRGNTLASRTSPNWDG